MKVIFGELISCNFQSCNYQFEAVKNISNYFIPKLLKFCKHQFVIVESV